MRTNFFVARIIIGHGKFITRKQSFETAGGQGQGTSNNLRDPTCSAQLYVQQNGSLSHSPAASAYLETSSWQGCDLGSLLMDTDSMTQKSEPIQATNTSIAEVRMHQTGRKLQARLTSHGPTEQQISTPGTWRSPITYFYRFVATRCKFFQIVISLHDLLCSCPSCPSQFCSIFSASCHLLIRPGLQEESTKLPTGLSASQHASPSETWIGTSGLAGVLPPVPSIQLARVPAVPTGCSQGSMWRFGRHTVAVQQWN